MKDYIVVDGTVVDAENYRITLQNRAFRFGDGLFETMRIANRKVLFIDDHLERLHKAMTLLRMAIPDKLLADTLSKQILMLCERYNSSDLRLRCSVFRKDGGLYAPTNLDVSYILEVWPLHNPHYELDELECLVLYSTHDKHADAFSWFKNMHTNLYALAGLYARDKNASDAVFLNQKKELCEATSSNIFIVRNNKLITPPLSSGCVAGIMRKQIITVASQIGFVVQEQSLTLEALHQANEVFLTNAIRGIRPVKNFETKHYKNNLAKELLVALNRLIE